MDRSLCKKGLRVRLIGPKSLWGPCGAKISARQFDRMNPGDELVLDENGSAISFARRNGDPDRFLVNVEIVEPVPCAAATASFPAPKPDNIVRGSDWRWSDRDGGPGSAVAALKPGDKVRIRPDLAEAKYGWGCAKAGDEAEIVESAGSAVEDWKNRIIVRLVKNNSKWLADPGELEPLKGTTMPQPKPTFDPGERVWHVNRKDWITLLDADPELNARDRYNALSDCGDRYAAIGDLLRRPGEPGVPEDPGARPKMAAQPTTFAPGQRWRLVATARDACHSCLRPGDDALVEAVDANGDALLADGKGRFALRRIANGDIVLLTQTETIKNPTKKDTPMTPIRITKPTLVDGNQISDYTARDRSALLSQHENEIKRLEALEFKTQETKDEIAALRAGVVAAIAEFDAEYAARKAAEAKA